MGRQLHQLCEKSACQSERALCTFDETALCQASDKHYLIVLAIGSIQGQVGGAEIFYDYQDEFWMQPNGQPLDLSSPELNSDSDDSKSGGSTYSPQESSKGTVDVERSPVRTRSSSVNADRTQQKPEEMTEEKDVTAVPKPKTGSAPIKESSELQPESSKIPGDGPTTASRHPHSATTCRPTSFQQRSIRTRRLIGSSSTDGVQ